MEIFNVMNIPAAALNKLLGKFFKDVRKQNGGEYEPRSVSSFQKSILESSPFSSYFSVCRFSSTKSST